MMYVVSMDLGHTTNIITVNDRRKATRQAKHPLVLDRGALDIAMAVTDVDLTEPGLAIVIDLVDGDGNKQGMARRRADGTFHVTIGIVKKAAYEDRHHYVANNSLLHELRHVAQMQADPNFIAAYKKAIKAVGYQANPYELEARYFGRLADHTGKKDTGPAGPAMGPMVWAVRFA